jgi:hypothetical protein
LNDQEWLLNDLEYFSRILEEKTIDYLTENNEAPKELVNYKHNEDSRIAYSSSLPSKLRLLKGLTIVKYNPNIKKIIERFPLKFYLIRHSYIVCIAENLVDEEMLKNITFAENYLNFYKLF